VKYFGLLLKEQI